MGSCKSKQNSNNHDEIDNTVYKAYQDDRTNDELTPQQVRDREARQMIDCMNRRGNGF